MKATSSKLLHLTVHVLSVWCLARIYYLGYSDRLGADPVEAIIHYTGLGAVNLLLLSLLVTPLVRYFRWSALIRLRRPLGLYACLYAVSHVINYSVYDLQMRWGLLVSEIVDRPYMTVGFAALCVLLVLAVTSVPRLVKRLGRRWKPLHRSVYVAAGLACVHFLWSVKADVTEPVMYLLALVILLVLRPLTRRHQRRRAGVSPAAVENR